jgi:hypothetical protein
VFWVLLRAVLSIFFLFLGAVVSTFFTGSGSCKKSKFATLIITGGDGGIITSDVVGVDVSVNFWFSANFVFTGAGFGIFFCILISCIAAGVTCFSVGVGIEDCVNI